jgi:ferric-dicitrate binding protein FerR (iron transport regulator)
MRRNLLCWVMLAVFPMSLFAADSGAAMLYAKGTAWLNGGTVPHSSAVFPGDLVQTKTDSMANINAAGSSVMILPDSVVKFEGDSVAVDRGSVSVTTAKGLSTHAENLTVTPVSPGSAQFEVSSANGKVQIVARKGDVSISDGLETTTLSEGQQTTREAPTQRTKRRRRIGAAPAAGGGVLDSPIVVAAGGAGIGALITWVLLQSSNPSSPSVP